MKKFRYILLIFIAASLTSCSGVKRLEDLEITSATIDAITPNGLKSLVIDLNVGIDNPGTEVSLTDFSCNFKQNGKVLGIAQLDQFTLKAKSNEIYDIKAELGLAEGVNILELTKLFSTTSLNEITVDLSSKIKLKGWTSKQLVFNDIPLKELLNLVNNEK